MRLRRARIDSAVGFNLKGDFRQRYLGVGIIGHQVSHPSAGPQPVPDILGDDLMARVKLRFIIGPEYQITAKDL